MVHSIRLRKKCEKLLSLLLGQCNPTMKAKIESRMEWQIIKDDYKVVEIIEAIRDVTYCKS